MTVHVKDPRSTFIHIPKTGGTSILTWLESEFNIQSDHKVKHLTISQLYKRYPVLGFSYAVVRNPWDRIISGYHYFANKGAPYVKDRRGEIMSFSKYLAADSYGKVMNPCQVDYIVDDTKCLRFETLNEDFEEIKKFYGSTRELELLNTSNHVHYSHYYTKQWMIDKVADYYAADIKRFNFDFEKEKVG